MKVSSNTKQVSNDNQDVVSVIEIYAGSNGIITDNEERKADLFAKKVKIKIGVVDCFEGSAGQIVNVGKIENIIPLLTDAEKVKFGEAQLIISDILSGVLTRKRDGILKNETIIEELVE